MTKLLFLPHCLNQEQKDKIILAGKQQGFEVHVAGGGSVVKNILKEKQNDKIEKIIGIACKDELELAKKYTKPAKENGTKVIPIKLKTNGCKNTIVDLNEVLKSLK